MTRISASVKPQELCDQMLIAEHREIIRIPNTIKSGKAIVKNIPESFRLGTGHVKFFYNKLDYLRCRYFELHKECLERGFNVADFSESFNGLPKHLDNYWEETKESRYEVVERINKNLSKMKKIRYFSENIKLENIVLC
tara:strand:+ start:79 stop:495 length:417 start_codon:yes stop_codon:yes gene_type:complete